MVVRETRQDIAKAEQSGPLKWSAKQLEAWVAQLEGGRFLTVSESFRLSGKLLSIEWRGDFVKRVCAAGGSEADADVIYDAFHQLIKKHKAATASKRGSVMTSISDVDMKRKSLYAERKAKFVKNMPTGDDVVMEKMKKEGGDPSLE